MGHNEGNMTMDETLKENKGLRDPFINVKSYIYTTSVKSNTNKYRWVACHLIDHSEGYKSVDETIKENKCLETHLLM